VTVKERNNYTVVLDFRVDGEKHTIDIDPDEPLLWVLCVDVGRAAGLTPVPSPAASRVSSRVSSPEPAVITS
jgi:hypothetical protein